ncbi:hypothetical protein ACWEBX_00210 [Streptomyces sp. NPDC005070]
MTQGRCATRPAWARQFVGRVIRRVREETARKHPGATGILSLYHGDHKVGEGRIKTQPGRFTLAGEGLTVGRDSGEAVTDHYPGHAPWSFIGATLHRVAVDVSGAPYMDLETEAQAMLARE